MQNFLSQAMEAAEDAGLHQGQGYANIEHAQYDNSQYGFAQDTNQFPIDQNLDIAVNFAASDAKDQDEGLGNNHMSLSAQNGHAGVMGSHHASTNTSTSLATATQPQTPLNPSTKRKSPEEIPENTTIGGDSRRKRSKVSRACDQCRKKKVRCDADTGDGNLKTCTNCIKQGQTCDYNRIPQKRGPSKGYIKDLSERVHHLEDSLANASNYRSSLDAGTYVDTAFSPEEDLALRRQTSISQQKSPFADFTRDRFPSVGGWNNQLPTPTRDRASIAIPPDQLPSSQPVSARSSKLWWAPERLPPAKVKTPAEIEETAKILENVNMDHYYEIVHAQCSVLPDKDRTLAILEKASPEYIIAFATAVNLLPQKKNDAAPAQLKTKEELETFIEEKARLKWRDKSNIDNLVLLWCTLFLHIVYIHDMQAHAKQNALVSIELDLISDFVKLREFLTHDSQYEFEWIRSFNMAALFARLNAVSQGDSRDPLPSYLSSYLNYTDWQVVAPRIRYTVMMTDIIQVALSMLPKDGVSFTSENLEGFARMQSSNMRAWLRSAEISAQEPFVKEIDAFVTLLSLRFISQGARPAVVGPVCNLVEAIRVNSLQTGEEQYLFNPLSFHTISLATTALLELQSCNFDDQQGQPLIETATSDMMKQLAELEARRAQLEGGAGGLFWAKALTNFAQDKLKQSVRAFPSPEDKGEDDVVPEMARILHQGYLFPLLNTISK